MAAASTPADLFPETRPQFDGFNAFYQAELAGWLRDQDSRRVRTLWQSIGLGLGATVGGGAVTIYGISLDSDLVALAGLAIVGIGLAAAFAKARRMRDEVKVFLMERICGFLDLTFRVRATGAPLDRFRSLRLIPRYDRSQTEDEITGTHQDVTLTLVEADLETEHTDEDGDTTYSRVFRGLLLRFDFPKQFNGTTIVTEDHGWLGNFFGKLGKPGARVALEDRRFEKAFEVYSTDQVEARYLLTPTFMERLVALGDLVGRKKLGFGFDGDELLIAIETKRDQFEGGSLLKRLDDPRRTQRLLDEVGLIFDIVETLNLQTKSRA